MTWEELRQKAKQLGINISDEREIYIETGLHFNIDGIIYYWSIDAESVFAENRTYEQMYQIMKALKEE